VRIGAFVAGLILVIGLPSIALAANVATFSSATPKPGLYTNTAMPTISVIVYDKYGVSGSTAYRALYLDTVKKSTTMTRYAGYGTKKFKLSFVVPANLAQGLHTVKVTVKDTAGHTSTYTWTFKVDTVPPVTTLSGGFPVYYTGVANGILLSATDGGSDVAYVKYSLDGGPVVTSAYGTDSLFIFQVFNLGTHTLSYWSVDKAGNVEPHNLVNLNYLSTTTTPLHSVAAGYQSVSCFQDGCHVGSEVGTTTLSVTAIHEQVPGRTDNGCGICHAGTGLPTADCATVGCHSASDVADGHQYIFDPHAGIHETTLTISSTSTPTACTDSGCHTTTLINASYIHEGGCSDCHGSADPRILAVISTALADDTTVTCEACHITTSTPTIDAIHNSFGAATDHAVSGACFTSGCHGGDISLIHASGVDENGDPAPGCMACHKNADHTGYKPALTNNCGVCHSDVSTIHNFTHVDATGTQSSACVACHGSDLAIAHNGVYTGQADLGCFCHFTGYLAGEMGPLVAAYDANNADGAQCTDCHKNAHAAHGFAVEPTGTITATMPIVSGHNTTTYGTIGALTQFDGTTGSNGVVVKDSTGATITGTWPLPTVNVFWSQAPTATRVAAAANGATTTVGWNSVITCQDCHTGLNMAGPHGANDNWGIDPNYSGDYERAVLWSNYTSDTAVPTTQSFNVGGIGLRTGPSGLTTTGAESTSWVTSNTTGVKTLTGEPGSSTNQQVICAKCHDLFNPGPGSWINTSGSTVWWNDASQLVTTVPQPGVSGWATETANTVVTHSDPALSGVNGWSNTPHASHHLNVSSGSSGTSQAGIGACINCHTSIPHGWVRPRLLIYYNDPTTVRVWPNGMAATQTSTLPAEAANQGLSAIGATGTGVPSLNTSGGVVWSEGGCNACGFSAHNWSGAKWQ
jgi:hypothetical protein